MCSRPEGLFHTRLSSSHSRLTPPGHGLLRRRLSSRRYPPPARRLPRSAPSCKFRGQQEPAGRFANVSPCTGFSPTPCSVSTHGCVSRPLAIQLALRRRRISSSTCRLYNGNRSTLPPRAIAVQPGNEVVGHAQTEWRSIALVATRLDAALLRRCLRHQLGSYDSCDSGRRIDVALLC